MALVLVIVAAVLIGPRVFMPAEPTPTADASQIDALQSSMLKPEELASIANTKWSVSTSSTKVDADTPSPQCVDVTEMKTKAEAVRQQVLQGEAKTDPLVLQLAMTYADADTATSAFAEISTSLGTCDPGPAYLRSGLSLTDLADEGTGVVVDALGTEFEHHTILLTRTGENITILDAAAGAANPNPSTLAPVAATALSRLCKEGGTCPAKAPAAKESLPPAGSDKGWLEPADLPRVTEGVGRWASTNGTLNDKFGSQCENVDLSKASGPTSRGIKTYLLSDDPDAPDVFGVDMVTFDFGDENAANTFGNTLRSNIAKCTARTRTATVAAAKNLDGTGADNAKITGTWHSVTQATSSGKTTYRVAVMNVGKRVVYLLDTPSGGFDFDDTQWSGLAVRAAQRASQKG